MPQQTPIGILDTNVVLLLPRLRDPDLLPQSPRITAITLAELTVGPLVAVAEEERVARQAHLQQAEADFEPLRGAKITQKLKLKPA
jgi:hypothetical protein